MSGPHPISAEAMEAYVNMRGIEREDDLDIYLRMIPRMDDMWMEDWGKRSEIERAKKKKTR